MQLDSYLCNTRPRIPPLFRRVHYNPTLTEQSQRCVPKSSVQTHIHTTVVWLLLESVRICPYEICLCILGLLGKPGLHAKDNGREPSSHSLTITLGALP